MSVCCHAWSIAAKSAMLAQTGSWSQTVHIWCNKRCWQRLTGIKIFILFLPNAWFKWIISSTDYEKTEDWGGGGTEKGKLIHVLFACAYCKEHKVPSFYASRWECIKRKKHVETFVPLPSPEQKRRAPPQEEKRALRVHLRGLRCWRGSQIGMPQHKVNWSARQKAENASYALKKTKENIIIIKTPMIQKASRVLLDFPPKKSCSAVCICDHRQLPCDSEMTLVGSKQASWWGVTVAAFQECRGEALWPITEELLSDCLQSVKIKSRLQCEKWSQLNVFESSLLSLNLVSELESASMAKFVHAKRWIWLRF